MLSYCTIVEDLGEYVRVVGVTLLPKSFANYVHCLHRQCVGLDTVHSNLSTATHAKIAMRGLAHSERERPLFLRGFLVLGITFSLPHLSSFTNRRSPLDKLCWAVFQNLEEERFPTIIVLKLPH